MKGSKDGQTTLVLQCPRSLGKPPLTLDFGALGLAPSVAQGLLRGTAATMGHNSADTQAKALWALKLMSQCLIDYGLATKAPLPGNIADLLSSWLDRSHLGPSAQIALGTTLRILAWCQRNLDGVVSPRATLLAPRIRKKPDPNPPKRLGGEELRKILGACYQEIELVEERLSISKRLQAGDARTDDERRLSQLVNELLALGDGELPTQWVVNRSGNAFARRIEEYGGHRALARHIWLTADGMFPFFLAILIQTGANMDAMREISNECVISHPLRSDLERLVWDKPRSNSEQWADFPVGRAWSAPSLVRRLKKLSESLLPKCPIGVIDRLFICYSPSAHHVSIPDVFTFYRELRIFLKRYDLPAFQLKELRAAGATQHHIAAGSIRAAQKRLKHKSVATTSRYTNLDDRKEAHDKTILKFQGELVRLSIGVKQAAHSADKTVAELSESTAADTVFGFSCRDPFSGVAVGSQKGSLCLQFARCAACPGALIEVDNPIVVGRLLSAMKALEEAEMRSIRDGWAARFRLLYSQTLSVLRDEIITAVHPDVLHIANGHVDPKSIPRLE